MSRTDGHTPDDGEMGRLRERISALAFGLTPRSEDEKRGMERVLAILDRKAEVDGGWSTDREYNRFHAGRKSGFKECATMLRAALAAASPEGEPER